MRDERSVRILFWAMIPVLLIPFALALAGLEPYPAVVFPGFPESGDPEGRIIYDRPAFAAWKDGAPTRIDYRDLLDDIPESYLSAVLQSRFSYDADNPEARIAEARRAGGTLGAYQYMVLREPRALSPWEYEQFRTWVDGHLRGMPDWRGGADSMTVTWYRVEVLEGGEERIEPNGRGMHIDLRDGAATPAAGS